MLKCLVSACFALCAFAASAHSQQLFDIDTMANTLIAWAHGHGNNYRLNTYTVTLRRERGNEILSITGETLIVIEGNTKGPACKTAYRYKTADRGKIFYWLQCPVALTKDQIPKYDLMLRLRAPLIFNELAQQIRSLRLSSRHEI